jgi:hypothetical protein
MLILYDEVFSGYQQRQVSVLNRHFKDHLSHHHQILDAADSPEDLIECNHRESSRANIDSVILLLVISSHV